MKTRLLEKYCSACPLSFVSSSLSSIISLYGHISRAASVVNVLLRIESIYGKRDALWILHSTKSS